MEVGGTASGESVSPSRGHTRISLQHVRRADFSLLVPGGRSPGDRDLQAGAA